METVAGQAEEPIQSAAPLEGQPAPVGDIAPASAAAPAEFSLDNVDDEVLTKHLAKKLGRKDLKSLDDLKPAPPKPSKEDLVKEEEEETKAAYSWALGSGKIKKEHYEDAIKEKGKTPREISLTQFAKEMREIDPKFSDTDIEELYKDATFENEAEDSPRRVYATKKIQREAEQYLAKFKDVDGIIEDYRSYNSNVNRQKNYSKSVKDVAKNLPREVSVDIPYTDESGTAQTATYKVPVEDKVFAQIVKKYDNPNMYDTLGLNDGKTELPEDYLQTQLAGELEFFTAAHVLKEVVKQHTDARIKDLEAKLNGFTTRTPPTPGSKPTPSTQKSQYDEMVEKQRSKAVFA